MAQEFARRNHTVVGCGTSAAGVAALQSTLGAPHDVAIVDVAQDKQVRFWAERVRATFGAPDLLLNNAAVINENAPLWEVSAEEFSRVVDVNIKGVANVLRHFVPAMIRHGRGIIVNFSSGWGRSTDSQVAPYCASKWAIEGLTRALAQELPAGLAAIPLNPGMINTDMLQSCFGSSARAYPTAAEWAKSAVAFLLQLSPKDNGRPLTAP
jgi:NAD(P)-dependent dehydrogenase (short-subunit alcohol dehydrogenase family)